MRRFNIRTRDIIAGIVALVGVGIVGIIGAGIVMSTGLYNVSAVYPHPPIVRTLLHYTFKRTVSVRADQQPPADLDSEGRRLLGTQHYANACAKCHGGPRLGQNPQALAMRPNPQHLASVVDQFTDSELHWILKNGVRFSAMPAWPTQDRDDEIWNVVAFLRELPDIDANTYNDRLKPKGDVPPVPYGRRGELLSASLGHHPVPEDEYLYAAPATEWRDFAVMGDPIARCAACHGADGSGSATNGRAPNLTLQNAAYLEKALTDYATGARKSGIMQIVAANLSGDQRRDLALYYDALPDVPAPDVSATDAELVLAGEQLAMMGNPEEVLPACTTCHNRPDTADGSVLVPNLAGQSQIYLAQQLELFRAGQRSSSTPWQPMHWVGSQLSDEDIRAVSAYFAQLDPGTELPAPEIQTPDLANAQGLVATVCKECHTERGIGSQSGEVPNLTLHVPDYIHQQLWAFREDIRTNSRMGQTARRLSPDDIRDLSAYFGRMEAVSVDRPVDEEAAERGAMLAMEGLPNRGVPACLTCHGSDTVNGLPLISRLHGQNEVYLKSRLDYFAGETGEDLYALSPMHGIATALTDEQRADVAAWFASKAPLPKPIRSAEINSEPDILLLPAPEE